MGLIASTNTIQGGRSGANAIRTPLAGTTQQEAIWSDLINSDGHVEVEALAGTGKSTTAAEGLHRMAESGCVNVRRSAVASFNRHIAKEMKDKLPAGAESCTLHSLGFRMLTAAQGETPVNQFKTEELAEAYFPGKWDEREERHAVAKLVALCKAGVVEDAEDALELRQVAAAFDVDLGKRAADILEVVSLVLLESKQRTSVIDYDDMLWLPRELDLRPTKPLEFLAVDEEQDLAPIQHDLIFRICPNGRIMGVGDRRQAIYAWRGASKDSMDLLAGRLEESRGLSRFPLTVTWRCPKSHVELAQKLVPTLEAAPHAKDGTVVDLRESELPNEVRPGDLVLCRNNAPLVSLGLRLITDNVRVTIRGRADLGKGLSGLVKRMKARSIADLMVKIEDYRVKQTEALSQLRRPEAAISSLYDRTECVLALCERHTSIEPLLKTVEYLFADLNDTDSVCLSTVHRAKGIERDRVFVIRPDLLPHPSARFDGQELNLLYVALTRAKNTLVFVGGRPGPLMPRTSGSDLDWINSLTFDPTEGSLD